MRFASRLTASSALMVTVCWALMLALYGSTDVLLFMAPALLIAAPLLAGRYVGEKLVIKLAERGEGGQRGWATRVWQIPKAPCVWRPRGTSLIAFSLAERPPPGSLIPQT